MTGKFCCRSYRRFFLTTLLVASAFGLRSRITQSPSSEHVYASETPTPPLTHPDVVCASCHKEIYERYKKTPMARGSGLATDGLIPGSFHHKLSGVDYAVFQRDGSAWMSYNRSASDPRGALSGEQRLEYFIGSGTQGRTYLYQQNGQWFELPINYYAQRNAWEMAPAYADATRMPAPLPTDPNCLHCHATNVQPSNITARNRYAGQPFLQGGIGCSACHGDPTAHLAQQGHGPIANPSKFAPVQRDSACIQCHLEGEAVVYRPGRSLARFVPGDNLADIAVYFVRASQTTGGNRAVSQYEALLQSACKRASGDKLTCTTCHDPHYNPSPAERVQYFRARCLSCHTNPRIASHHTEQPDCATCHMPSRLATDISHDQVADHDIEAHPHVRPTLDEAVNNNLIPIGASSAGDREFGLAYEQLATRGLPQAGTTALRLLLKATEAGQSDRALESRLGYLLQVSGDFNKARKAYSTALQSDPYDPTALANLAVLDASSGHLPEAIHLLDRLTTADPSQTSAGLNLAFIECKLNQPDKASNLLQRLFNLNPDNAQLREFMDHSIYQGQHCNLHPDAPPATHQPSGKPLLPPASR